MTEALIVPIDIQALCVGRDDVQGDGNYFAGLSADFSRIPKNADDAHAPVARDLVAAPFAYGDTPCAGVNLHWALPDALTKGADSAAGIAFPAVPNRWLVVRLPGGAGSPVAWVIESDRLNDSAVPSAGAPSRQVPILDAQGRLTSTHLGRAWRAADWRHDPTPGMTPLTALGYGEPLFAAVAAHAPNVFAFCDKGLGLPTTAGLQSLDYAVFGWYDGDGAVDPLREPALPLDSLAWTMSPGDTPTRTICAGVLRGVQWDPIANVIAPDAAATFDVVIAQNHAEAFAALLAKRASLGEDEENSLLLFQLGLLRPRVGPDAAAEIAEAVHAAQFSFDDAGTIWSIAPDPAVPRAASESLPVYGGDVARALVDLNIEQAAFDAARAVFASRQRRLFGEWYAAIHLKYPVAGSGVDVLEDAQNLWYGENGGANLMSQAAIALVGTPPAEAAAGNRQAMIAFIATVGDLTSFVLSSQPGSAVPPSLIASAAAKSDDPDDLGKLLEQRRTLAASSAALDHPMPGLRLTASPAPRYASAADPVILIAGPMAVASPRHGGDGILTCRRATELLTGMAMPDLDLPATGLPAEINALVIDALVTVTGRKSEGVPPSDVGVVDWQQPWIPLIAQWRITVRPEAPTPVGALAAYSLGNDAIELRPRSDAALPPAETTYVTLGQMMLAPNGETALGSQITQYLAANPHDADAPTLEAIRARNLAAMSQCTSGFNSALELRTKVIQLPVCDPMADPHDADYLVSNMLVPAAVGRETTAAPVTAGTFQPLRTGVAQLTDLRLIDAFGRFRDIIDRGHDDPTQPIPIVAASLLSPRARAMAEAGFFELAPRLVQPSRLLCHWLSAVDGRPQLVPESAASPIFGWLMFDHLESSLAVFAADGTLLGTLDVDNPDIWGAVGLPADPHLADFVSRISQQVIDDIAAGRPDMLEAMLAAIDLQLSGINPLGFRQDRGLALLIGRPLALARLTLSLEMQGDLATNPSDAAVYAMLREAAAGATPVRDDGGLAGLTVPVRLGDLGLLEDGLVGYFVGGSPVFYAAAVPPAEVGHAKVVAARAIELTPVAAGTPPVCEVTLMFDPRGAIHATTGILPVVETRLAEHLFAPAMARLAIEILATPTLVLNDLPLYGVPAESGYTWAWSSRTGTTTTSRWLPPTAAPVTVPGRVAIVEGYLRLLPAA